MFRPLGNPRLIDEILVTEGLLGLGVSQMTVGRLLDNIFITRFSWFENLRSWYL